MLVVIVVVVLLIIVAMMVVVLMMIMMMIIMTTTTTTSTTTMIIRRAQTANYCYNPNTDLPFTFMALAMVLPDFDSPNEASVSYSCQVV